MTTTASSRLKKGMSKYLQKSKSSGIYVFKSSICQGSHCLFSALTKHNQHNTSMDLTTTNRGLFQHGWTGRLSKLPSWCSCQMVSFLFYVENTRHFHQTYSLSNHSKRILVKLRQTSSFRTACFRSNSSRNRVLVIMCPWKKLMFLHQKTGLLYS